VGALGHFIEREGVPTAQVSLIREQTAAIKPPRALWVPFMLGRPFGAPNQPDFQRRVVRALLDLFERPAGPVLEDFPEEAPMVEENDHEGALACAVSFAKPVTDDDDLAAAMLREVAQLAPWYDIALKRRGRTSFGISGMAIEDAARYAVSYLGNAPPAPRARDIPPGVALKRVCDDIKTYYYEAMAAQPGNLLADVIEHCFWHETAAGKVFLALREVCLASGDESLRLVGKGGLVPRAVVHGR